MSGLYNRMRGIFRRNRSNRNIPDIPKSSSAKTPTFLDLDEIERNDVRSVSSDNSSQLPLRQGQARGRALLDDTRPVPPVNFPTLEPRPFPSVIQTESPPNPVNIVPLPPPAPAPTFLPIDPNPPIPATTNQIRRSPSLEELTSLLNRRRRSFTINPNSQLVDSDRSRDPPLADFSRSRGAPLVDFPRSRGAPLADFPRSRDSPLVDFPRSRGAPLADFPRSRDSPLVDFPRRRDSPLVDFPRSRGAPLADFPRRRDSPLVDFPRSRGAPLADFPRSRDSPLVDFPRSRGAPLADFPRSRVAPMVNFPRIRDFRSARSTPASFTPRRQLQSPPQAPVPNLEINYPIENVFVGESIPPSIAIKLNEAVEHDRFGQAHHIHRYTYEPKTQHIAIGSHQRLECRLVENTPHTGTRYIREIHHPQVQNLDQLQLIMDNPLRLNCYPASALYFTAEALPNDSMRSY